MGATVDKSELTSKLDSIKISNKQPKAMQQAAQVLYELIMDTWRTQSDPWGAPWPALKPSTIAGRLRAENYSTQQLVGTGGAQGMRASVKASYTDSEAAVEGGGNESGAYYNVHQFGTTNAGRNRKVVIPQRATFPNINDTEAKFPQVWIDKVFAPILTAVQEQIDGA